VEDKLPWLFTPERGQPMTCLAVNYPIGAAAAGAGLPGVHPHTLRQSLADKGTDLKTI
jgi:site-specific recombinase XerD